MTAAINNKIDKALINQDKVYVNQMQEPTAVDSE